MKLDPAAKPIYSFFDSSLWKYFTTPYTTLPAKNSKTVGVKTGYTYFTINLSQSSGKNPDPERVSPSIIMREPRPNHVRTKAPSIPPCSTETCFSFLFLSDKQLGFCNGVRRITAALSLFLPGFFLLVSFEEDDEEPNPRPVLLVLLGDDVKTEEELSCSGFASDSDDEEEDSVAFTTNLVLAWEGR